MISIKDENAFPSPSPPQKKWFTLLVTRCTNWQIPWLTLNLLNFLNEIINLPFWNSPLSVLEIEVNSIVWSDCTDVHAGLALCWWQRLITFGSSRIRVNMMWNFQMHIKLANGAAMCFCIYEGGKIIWHQKYLRNIFNMKAGKKYL